MTVPLFFLSPAIMGRWESGINCWEGQGACARVILVVRECIWNAPAVSFVLPACDFTGSLGSPRQMVYPPGSIVPPCVTASRFLVGNREAELKPTIFSSVLLFRVFLSFLFS